MTATPRAAAHAVPPHVPSLATRARRSVADAIAELRTRPPGQVFVLDALRSLAVLLVVMDHSYVWWGEAGGGESIVRRLPFIHFGWTGVDLFFILSGYLIGRQLWREYQRTGDVDVPQFVLRRGFRIWPLYAVFAIGTPLLTSAPFAWSDVLFVSNYVGGSVRGGWSLSTEEQFYIVLPLAVALLARIGSLRAWTIGLVAMLASVEVARHLTASGLFAAGHATTAVKNAMYSPGHLHCEGLLMGALIALLEVRRPGLLAPVRSARGVWAAVGIGAGGLLAAGVLRTASPVVLPYLSLALLYGGMTVALLLLRESRLVRFFRLDSVILYRISRLSYGVYLNHFFVVKWVIGAALPVVTALTANRIVGFGAAVVLAVVASLACAAVLFVLVEHPFLQARGVVLAARKSRAAAATPGGVAPVHASEAILPTSFDSQSVGRP